MARRFKPQPPIKMSFWKRDGKLWYAAPSELMNAIESTGIPDKLIRERMGVGYHLIQDVLDRKRIEGWSVAHIEWGLSPIVENPMIAHGWPPR